MKIPFVSDWIPQRLRAIPRHVWAAMLAALVFGLACHNQSLTQQLINHDTVTTTGDNGMWLLTQGKWFFGYIASLRGSVATSGIETTLALLIISVTAGLTVSILRIKSTVHAALVGAFMIAFPSVFCNFLYHGEDTFFAALLLATLAVYFTTKYKYGYIGGTILLTLSLGTYQTYIGFVAGLFIIVIIIDILEKVKKPRKILLDGLKYILVMLVSVALYYLCLQAIIALSGVELSGYMGVNSMGNLSVGNILSQSWKAYKDTLKFMLFDSFGTRQAVFVWSYRLVIAASIVLFVLIVFKRKLYKNIFMLVLALVLGGFALPLAVHAIYVLVPASFTHWLMKYPFVLMFVFMPALLECFVSSCRDVNTEGQIVKRNIFSGLQWLTVVLAVVLVFNWYILANQCNQKMRYVKDSIYAKTSELVMAIHNNENYKKDIKVAFVGDAPFEYMKDPKSQFNIYQSFTGFDDAENVFYSSSILQAYMFNYLGVSFNTVDGAAFVKQHSEEVDNLSVFPSGDSIELIDDVLVVKLSEIPDK